MKKQAIKEQTEPGGITRQNKLKEVKQMEYTETLENIIFKQGLANTLRDIEQICYEKADHAQTNWQDTELAKEWTRFGGWINTAIGKINL